MGTRSRIAVMHGDVCKSVYCHWDGYLEHNGFLLMNHYDSVKANNLVALGDISSLGEEIGEEHPFDKYDLTDEEKQRYESWTTFYGRDRGEENVGYKVDHTFEDFLRRVDNCGGEWYYVMRDGEWYCGNTYRGDKLYGRLVPLATAIHELSEQEAE